jgi:hypothetical protein
MDVALHQLVWKTAISLTRSCLNLVPCLSLRSCPDASQWCTRINLHIPDRRFLQLPN